MKKLYLIGIGPGAREDMTYRAASALEASEVIVGYTVYIDLLRPGYSHKELISTPMRTEQKRCEMALRMAEEDKVVAMVCSGDAGVYGMAGLCYQLSPAYPEVELEVIPGVTAATAGAALLGAPLMHDFAVISLSDLLTPWEVIEARLRFAAQGDFVLCLYNPSSRKRRDYLQRACDILLEYLPGITACGLASHIGREGEVAQVLTLSQLRETPVDMFTTVYIGNRQTEFLHNKLVTPRGYRTGGTTDAT